MCYSFQSFMLGLASSFGLLVPLNWYRCGPDGAILNPRIWEIIIILIGTGGMSVAVAFIVLPLCIQSMDHSPATQTSATFYCRVRHILGMGLWAPRPLGSPYSSLYLFVGNYPKNSLLVPRPRSWRPRVLSSLALPLF